MSHEVVCVPVFAASPWTLSYVIDNTAAASFNVELNFSGSTNVTVANSTSLQVTVVLGAFDRKFVRLSRVDESTRCAIRFQYAIVRKELSTLSQEISELDKTKQMTIDQTPSQGAHYMDQSFLPHSSTLQAGSNEDICFAWKHLSDFYDIHAPIFDYKDLTSSLTRGGSLVSNAMASAFVAVSKRHEDVSRMIWKSNQGFEIQLYLHGQAKVIQVDGFLPCAPRGGPVLMKCTQGYLWPLLLQKGLAKLYGGYYPLTKVSFEELLINIFSYSTLLLFHVNHHIQASIQLNRIQAQLSHRNVVCASIGNGVFVVAAVESSNVILHNLSSELAQGESKEQINDREDKTNHTVAVTIKQFLSMTQSLWYLPQGGPFAKVCRRRYFTYCNATCTDSEALFALSITSTALTLITLNSPSPKWTQIEFAVLAVQDDYKLCEVASCSNEKSLRFCQLQLYLHPGEYVIAIKRSLIIGEKCHENNNDDEEQLARFFDVLDTDMDKRLNFEDLKRFIKLYESELTIDEAAYEWLIREFESDKHGLTLQGLRECYNANCTTDYKNEIFQNSSPCILAVHSECSGFTLIQVE